MRSYLFRLTLPLLAMQLVAAAPSSATVVDRCHEAAVSVLHAEPLARRHADTLTQSLCLAPHDGRQRELALAWRSRHATGWLLALRGVGGWRVALSRSSKAHGVALGRHTTTLIVTETLSAVPGRPRCQRELVRRYRVNAGRPRALGRPRRLTVCSSASHKTASERGEEGSPGELEGESNIPVPTLSGRAALADTLTCSPGVWNDGVTELSYTWQRGYLEQDPAGAGSWVTAGHGVKYTVSSADLGHALRCVVEGRGRNWALAVESSALPVAPLVTAPPVVSGTGYQRAFAVDEQLVCERGAWQGLGYLNPASFSYRWLRDGRPLSGASGAAYVPVAADVGHQISCVVEAVDYASERLWPGMPLSEPVEAVSAPVTIAQCYSDQAPYCVLPETGESTNDVFSDTLLKPGDREITDGLLTVTGVRNASAPDEVHLSITVQLDMNAPETIDVVETYCTEPIIMVCDTVQHSQSYALSAGHHELVIDDAANAAPVIAYAAVAVFNQQDSAAAGFVGMLFEE